MDGSLIENKVAKSGLSVINLSDFLPANKRLELDIKDFLFQGLILREKEFRKEIAEFDKTPFADAYVAVFCSEDTVIPVWAYMLIAKELFTVAKNIFKGTLEEMEEELINQSIEQMETAAYQDARVIIKGCEHPSVKPSNYLKITQKLLPVVKSLMYGEPCSTVPIYKKK